MHATRSKRRKPILTFEGQVSTKMIAQSTSHDLRDQRLEIDKLISRARGSSTDRGTLLTRYEGYLAVIAALEIYRAGLCRRLSKSDVVQDTLLKAEIAFEQFSGQCEQDLSAWLRQILKNHMVDQFRKFYAAKRDIRLEQSDYFRSDGSAILTLQLPNPTDLDSDTPSQQAIRGEQALLLAEAIESLTPRQSETIRLRFFAGLKVKEIADHLEISTYAVVGLLRRGMESLRAKLPPSLNDAIS